MFTCSLHLDVSEVIASLTLLPQLALSDHRMAANLASKALECACRGYFVDVLPRDRVNEIFCHKNWKPENPFSELKVAYHDRYVYRDQHAC